MRLEKAHWAALVGVTEPTKKAAFPAGTFGGLQIPETLRRKVLPRRSAKGPLPSRKPEEPTKSIPGSSAKSGEERPNLQYLADRR
jgi:hypothetical protein